MKYIIIAALSIVAQFAEAQNCPGFSSVSEANAFTDASTLAGLKFLRSKYKNEGVKVEQVAFLEMAVSKGQEISDCELMTFQSKFEVVYLKQDLGCIVRGIILGSGYTTEEVQITIVEDSISAPDCRAI